jgi:hypothetical protein
MLRQLSVLSFFPMDVDISSSEVRFQFHIYKYIEHVMYK